MNSEYLIWTLSFLILSISILMISLTLIGERTTVDFRKEYIILDMIVSKYAVWFSCLFVSVILVSPKVFEYIHYRTGISNRMNEKVIKISIVRFFAGWSRRMWEVSLPLVLIDTFGNTLVPTATYTVVVFTFVIILQPFVGDWADKSNRLVSQTFAICLENFAIIMTSILLVYLSFKYEDTNTSITASKETIFIFILLCFLGIIGEVSVNCSSKMLENDWVSVISSAENIEPREVNALLKRISLLAKALGPAAFTFIYSSFGNNPKIRVAFSLLMLTLWNILSFPLEVLCTRTVYISTKELANKSHSHGKVLKHSHLKGEKHHFHIILKDSTELTIFTKLNCFDKETNESSFVLPSDKSNSFRIFQKQHTLSTFTKELNSLLIQSTKTKSDLIVPLLVTTNLNEGQLAGAKIVSNSLNKTKSDGFMLTKWCSYFHLFSKQKVFLVCIAHSFLWFSVLNNGNLMMSFLHVSGIPTYYIGISRSVGAVVGFAGTYLYQWQNKNHTTENCGLKSLWLMFFVLFPVAILYLVFPTTNALGYILMIFTAFSRIGLWGFNLARLEIFQKLTNEEVKGVVSSVHVTTYQFCYILMFIAGLFFNKPEDFYILVVLSVVSLLCSAVTYTYWYSTL